MRQIIKLQPQFHYRIWGGERIKNYYPNLDQEKTGEAWITSCIPGSENAIDGKNLNLNEFWKENPEFFGVDTSKTEFPLLVKIIDAKADLSIQVHPDDEMANKLENYPYGKSECWYILEASEKSSIIYGLNSSDISEIKTMISENKWEELLSNTKVNEGEIYNIPAGLTHAIKEDNLILEVQQPCDITYRLYDYNRLEADGSPRELHLEKGIASIKPEITNKKTKSNVTKLDSFTKTNLLSTEYFQVSKIDLNGETIFSECDEAFTKWANIFINNGEIVIGDETFIKGDSIIISSDNHDLKIQGKGQFFIIK